MLRIGRPKAVRSVVFDRRFEGKKTAWDRSLRQKLADLLDVSAKAELSHARPPADSTLDVDERGKTNDNERNV
jgi:hypothetical protein